MWRLDASYRFHILSRHHFYMREGLFFINFTSRRLKLATVTWKNSRAWTDWTTIRQSSSDADLPLVGHPHYIGRATFATYVVTQLGLPLEVTPAAHLSILWPSSVPFSRIADGPKVFVSSSLFISFYSPRAFRSPTACPGSRAKTWVELSLPDDSFLLSLRAPLLVRLLPSFFVASADLARSMVGQLFNSCQRTD